MQRKADKLAQDVFDMVIIGGGVYGLCTAWDATLRGLKIAVLEKDDFAHASSSVNYKLIHGGLRYLQHLDFKRMRISIRERRHMMTMAPHLVSPVEFVVPCYGHGMKGPEVLWTALQINDLVGFDRNKGIDRERRIPRGHLLSREECLRRVPGLSADGLTGGAVYYDAQMYSAERLALSFGRAAERDGATLINYAEVTGLNVEGGRVQSATVRDKVSGRTLTVRGNLFINMTGPWSEITRQLLHTPQPEHHVIRSKGVQLFTRSLAECGFTVQTRQVDKTAIIARGGRSLFVTPWRGKSFIGQSDTIYEGDPDDFEITEQDIAAFLSEFNEAYPAARLTRDDIEYWLGGMIPVGTDDPNADAANISHRYEILDHEKEDGVGNMISVIGVKFTITRYIAEQVVDRALKKLGRPAAPCSTAKQKVYGGDIDQVSGAVQAAMAQHDLDHTTAHHLVRLYGSEIDRVMRYAREHGSLGRHVAGSKEALRAEIVHAVREEMALHVDDVLIRRSDMGTLGYPGADTVKDVAQLMASELGWDDDTRRAEIERIRTYYRV